MFVTGVDGVCFLFLNFLYVLWRSIVHCLISLSFDVPRVGGWGGLISLTLGNKTCMCTKVHFIQINVNFHLLIKIRGLRVYPHKTCWKNLKENNVVLDSGG